MGRPRKNAVADVDGQQDLIDVDTPEGKAAMKIGRAYRRMREEHNDQRTKMRDKEQATADKLRAAISDLGIAPQADGSYHCVLDGYEVVIPAPKNPPIKIKAIKNVDESEEEDEAAEE